MRRFFSLYITFFLDGFGLALVYPILTPLFLAPESNFFSATSPLLERTILLGLTLALFPMAQFFSAPIIGRISDQTERKKVLLFTIAGTGIGYCLTGLAIHYQLFWLLATSRFWTGFFAGNMMLCLAAVADLCKEEKKRSRHFGILAGMGGLGFIFSILFGGILSDASISGYFNPSLPFLVTSFLSLLNLLQVLFFFPQYTLNPKAASFFPLHHIGLLREALMAKGLKKYYAIYFFFMIGWVGTMQFIPTYLLKGYSVGSLTITKVLFFVGVIWSSTNILVQNFLINFLNFGRILWICLLCLSCLLFLTSLSLPFSIFLGAIYLGIVFAALAWTNTLTLISTHAPENLQGSILGINQSIGSTASILGPLLGGFAAGISPRFVFVFTGLTIFCSFMLHTLKGKKNA